MSLEQAGKVTRENLGAWMIKCNPKVWDLEAYRADGGRYIDDWSVQHNYRAQLMEPGDLIFFWVTGPDNSRIKPGVWGVGHVLAPSDWAIFKVDSDEENSDGYWLDHEAMLKARYFTEVDIPLLKRPVTRSEIASDKRFAGLEVLVQPQMGNPLYIAPEETELLLDLVGGAPEMPELDFESIGVDQYGADHADPATRLWIELAAMGAVTDRLEADGWSCTDVSADRCGWDITARRNSEQKHVEVKGLSRSLPQVMLTRHEYRVAESDPAWCLMVVTDSLTEPVIREYPADQVLAASQPYVYKTVLS